MKNNSLQFKTAQGITITLRTSKDKRFILLAVEPHTPYLALSLDEAGQLVRHVQKAQRNLPDNRN